MFLSGFDYYEKCAFFSLAKNIVKAGVHIAEHLLPDMLHFVHTVEHRSK